MRALIQKIGKKIRHSKEEKRELFRHRLTKWLKCPGDLHSVVVQLDKYNEPWKIREKDRRFAVYVRKKCKTG